MDECVLRTVPYLLTVSNLYLLSFPVCSSPSRRSPTSRHWIVVASAAEAAMETAEAVTVAAAAAAIATAVAVAAAVAAVAAAAATEATETAGQQVTYENQAVS